MLTSLLRSYLITMIIAVGALAAAPDSLVGHVYYQSGRTIARSSYQLGLTLESDGTFRHLFSGTTIALSGGSPFSNSAGEDGTWSYRRIDEATGELLLMTSSGANPFSGNRTLRFTSDSEGFIAPETLPVGGFSGTFRIAASVVRAPLVNCSNRSFVRAGGNAFTGFVISGDAPRTVLVRAVGPGLAAFGITDALNDPKIAITADSRTIAQNDDWNAAGPSPGGESIRRTSAYVGAFPLSSTSKDAAVVVQLSPGAYVVQVSAATPTDSGEVLIEVYMLP